MLVLVGVEVEEWREKGEGTRPRWECLRQPVGNLSDALRGDLDFRNISLQLHTLHSHTITLLIHLQIAILPS